MAFYTIKPIKVGKISYYRGAFTSNQEEYKAREDFPVLIFLIEGNGRKILFDTGSGDPALKSMHISNHGPGIERKPEEAPDAALKALGVNPEEIDTVIMSHLHWDHCYNNQLFPQADFYIQKEELISAVCPLPKFKVTYETFYTGVVPPWARQATKWKVIDGDFQLCDGIKLLQLPGHSLGLQGALIDTKGGQYLLPSDAVPLKECIEKIDEGVYGMSSLCADIEAFYATFERMRELHKNQHVEILASHDFITLEHKVYPDI
jgi:N-acyl homoserine lactone hydrolase